MPLKTNENKDEKEKLNLEVINPTWTSIAIPAAMSSFMSCERRRMGSDSDTSVVADPFSVVCGSGFVQPHHVS